MSPTLLICSLSDGTPIKPSNGVLPAVGQCPSVCKRHLPPPHPPPRKKIEKKQSRLKRTIEINLGREKEKCLVHLLSIVRSYSAFSSATQRQGVSVDVSVRVLIQKKHCRYFAAIKCLLLSLIYLFSLYLHHSAYRFYFCRTKC